MANTVFTKFYLLLLIQLNAAVVSKSKPSPNPQGTFLSEQSFSNGVQFSGTSGRLASTSTDLFQPITGSAAADSKPASTPTQFFQPISGAAADSGKPSATPTQLFLPIAAPVEQPQSSVITVPAFKDMLVQYQPVLNQNNPDVRNNVRPSVSRTSTNHIQNTHNEPRIISPHIHTTGSNNVYHIIAHTFALDPNTGKPPDVRLQYDYLSKETKEILV